MIMGVGTLISLLLTAKRYKLLGTGVSDLELGTSVFRS